MLTQELINKIKVYLKPLYFEPQAEHYELWERTDSGLSKLDVKVTIEDPNNVLCIAEYDLKPKCNFLNESASFALQKSVDHVLLCQKEDGLWDAHLIEMKTTVYDKRWEEIRGKMRASMLNVLAVAAVLGITIEEFYAYTTYEHVSTNDPLPTDLAARKRPLGRSWKRDEWDQGFINIRIPIGKQQAIKHKGLQMTRQEYQGKSTLCGSFNM